MEHKEITKLYSLKGTLRGQRAALQSELRIALGCARPGVSDLASDIYKFGARGIVRLLQLHRVAERNLDQIIREAENA